MNKIVYVLLCLLPAISMAQDKKTIINGTSDITRPTVIRVMYYNKFTNSKIYDSAAVVNGKFSLTVPFAGVALVVNMIATYDNKEIQPEDVADTRLFFVDKDGSDIHIKDKVSTAELSHNRIEEEKKSYLSYLYQVEADSAKMGMLNGFHPMIARFEVNQVPDSVKDAEGYKNYKNMIEYKIRQEKFLQVRYDRLEAYIRANPDSYFSIPAIEELIYGKHDLDRIPSYISGLSNRLRNSPEPKYLEDLLAGVKSDMANPQGATARANNAAPKSLMEGAMAPDFTQFDADGKPVKMSDFKGRYVLVDFWASWCVPCRKENPNVVKAYEQFKDKNFTVLGIALEQKGSKAAWLDAIRKDGLVWTQVTDAEKGENPAARAFGVSGIPICFLIDPSGRIIAKDIRGEQLLEKLSEVLSN